MIVLFFLNKSVRLRLILRLIVSCKGLFPPNAICDLLHDFHSIIVRQTGSLLDKPFAKYQCLLKSHDMKVRILLFQQEG
jgi:hypothetical protein